ncbi:intermembrane transport protein PqiB [Phragmitibacter flavus]|uniref:Intermembrane transport protein PqiB n=1 Tax=Phragmitibacter flavus TaxID=2576071 RepID=A0A5R8KJ94_9BACT|nr:intermembrane transport protein PqiB [Phragmitibacter flavus]TLD72396.1 intermembrane transport protein PqiB [Phragmitibacter flavus]
MSDPASNSTTTSEPRATIKRSRRWSTVWIVPFVALALGAWLVWEHYRSLGPLVYVRFETADSIVSGKTDVRARSVSIGMVEAVTLAKDLQSVIVAIRMQPDSEELLREGSRFWVVKPRISAADVSGLGTIITGAYIELDPGDGREDVHHFDGLEKPPITSSSVPGLRLVLEADNPGSLNVGSPIYYKGFEVGRVEQRSFDIKSRRTNFDIFIGDPYAELVHEGTAFWNSSGVDISAGADGFRVRTPSFQAMLSGGATFAVPPGAVVGKEATNGTVFTLFPDEEATRKATFVADRRCLLFFDQSVRGLQNDAPVEFRGIPLGRVVDISFDYAPTGEKRVPVLIEVDPSVLRNPSQKAANEKIDLAEAVSQGLRAKLGTASLLTGALYIDIDFVEDAPPATMGKVGEYEVFPTHSSGLVQLEAKVNAILTKIEALPIEDTLNKFGDTAESLTATTTDARAALAEINKLLSREETQNLTAELDATLNQVRASVSSLGPSGAIQGDLHRTLDELRAALRAFKTLSNTIDDKPNSLIFGRDNKGGDPVPRSRR